MACNRPVQFIASHRAVDSRAIAIHSLCILLHAGTLASEGVVRVVHMNALRRTKRTTLPGTNFQQLWGLTPPHRHA